MITDMISVNIPNVELSTKDAAFCHAFREKLRKAAEDYDSVLKYDVISTLPLHVRHPRAAALREMVSYPHFPDLTFLDGDDMPFPYLLLYQSGKPYGRTPAECRMNGVSQAMFPDAEWGIRMLWAIGFLASETISSNTFVPSALGFCVLHSIYYDRGEYISELLSMNSAPRLIRKIDIIGGNLE